MKILYVTTIGITMGFFKSFIKGLIEEGHTVEIACNDADAPVPAFYSELGCRVHRLSCSRSPFAKGNLMAVKEIRRLVKANGYDIVHCHTPIAAACTRLACRKLRKKQGVKVFYTAHGFHFYKGAPLKNWMVYYPVEKLCARYTDKLITINSEDFALAQKKMKAKEVVYVPGVGVDLTRFRSLTVDKVAKRRELGIPESATLLLSVGEVNQNKNHQVIVRAMAQLQRDDLHYMIAGVGHKQDALKQQATALGIGDKLHLLGYRNDVADLLSVADCFVFPSYREGLSVSLMEAMSCGLPCVVSRIRGNTDLIDDKGGALFNPHKPEECVDALRAVLDGDSAIMRDHNKQKIQFFSLESVLGMMYALYEIESR
ncbi:MAG: glycosyltransferase family 4 protein [Clostridia bacterium]|nr:glycosyltransferase family 4 protein [Clostridia bacterium]